MKRELLTMDELIEMYNEAIDSEGTVNIGYLTFSRSDILEELDPIAYRCGLNDYYDSICDEYYCEDME